LRQTARTRAGRVARHLSRPYNVADEILFKSSTAPPLLFAARCLMHAVLLIRTFLLAIIICTPHFVCYVCGDDDDGRLHQPAKKNKKSARRPPPGSFSMGEGRRREWIQAAVTGGVPASLRRPRAPPLRSSSCYRTDDECARGWSAVAPSTGGTASDCRCEMRGAQAGPAARSTTTPN